MSALGATAAAAAPAGALFRPLSAEDGEQQPAEIESLCMNCFRNVRGPRGPGSGGLRGLGGTGACGGRGRAGQGRAGPGPVQGESRTGVCGTRAGTGGCGGPGESRTGVCGARAGTGVCGVRGRTPVWAGLGGLQWPWGGAGRGCWGVPVGAGARKDLLGATAALGAGGAGGVGRAFPGAPRGWGEVCGAGRGGAGTCPCHRCCQGHGPRLGFPQSPSLPPQGVTRLLLTRIPFFKEIIVSSFSCPSCSWSNTEIQAAGRIQEQGVRYTLAVTSRQVGTAPPCPAAGPAPAHPWLGQASGFPLCARGGSGCSLLCAGHEQGGGEDRLCLSPNSRAGL